MLRIVKQTLRDSGYLLASLPIAIISFTIVVTGLSLGLGLAIVWIGLPIGVGTLFAARGFADLERTRLRARGTVIDAAPGVTGIGGTWLQRFLRPLRWGALWREALHAILTLPLVCVTWSLALTWWALVVSGLTGWIWEPISTHYGGTGSGANALMHLLGWPISGALFDLICGVFALVTLPALTRVCAEAHAGLGRALLSPSQGDLKARVAELSAARDQLSKAEAGSLRRLERDIHDGPQQTLIRLGMDLAASQRRLAEGDVAAATSLIEGARQMTDSAIGDLRSLSRSIAPPILRESGLGAALQAAAATSTIPTAVHYELDAAPSEAVATAVYFVACEALSNAVKHSKASHIELRVANQDDQLVLTVHDDGVGGAVLLPEHGLAGLRDRVAAMDGTLEITDQPGTTITARWPMGGMV